MLRGGVSLAGQPRRMLHFLSIRVGHLRLKKDEFIHSECWNLWKSLPQRAIDAEWLIIFIIEIDRILEVRGIKGCGDRG